MTYKKDRNPRLRQQRDEVEEEFEELLKEPEEDTHGTEVDLFEKFELSIFVKLCEIHLDGRPETMDDVWSAINFAIEFGYGNFSGYKGWTPMEVAYRLYKADDYPWVLNHIFNNYRELPSGAQQYWRDWKEEQECNT